MQSTVSAFLLCLLSAVILSGAQETPTNGTDVSRPTVAVTNSTEAATNSTATNPTITTNTDVGATPSPESGLSDGAIAGITIGSIAGVGLVGGGVYGLLKYTGKI